MLCQHCGRRARLTGSHVRPKSIKRDYVCADHGRFTTWETTTPPPRNGAERKRAKQRAEKLAYRRDWQREMRERDPEKYAAHRQRWKLRAEARHAAAETGEPVEAIYARWGVD